MARRPPRLRRLRSPHEQESSMSGREALSIRRVEEEDLGQSRAGETEQEQEGHGSWVMGRG